MEAWHSRVLGTGSDIYMRLRQLNGLRHEMCPTAISPFMLAIDVDNAQTLAFFPPEHSALARAFGAHASLQPAMDGIHLRDLEYQPLPVNEVSWEVFEPLFTPHARS